MASIEFWIQWRNAHGPILMLFFHSKVSRSTSNCGCGAFLWLKFQKWLALASNGPLHNFFLVAGTGNFEQTDHIRSMEGCTVVPARWTVHVPRASRKAFYPVQCHDPSIDAMYEEWVSDGSWHWTSWTVWCVLVCLFLFLFFLFLRGRRRRASHRFRTIKVHLLFSLFFHEDQDTNGFLSIFLFFLLFLSNMDTNICMYMVDFSFVLLTRSLLSSSIFLSLWSASKRSLDHPVTVWEQCGICLLWLPAQAACSWLA